MVKISPAILAYSTSKLEELITGLIGAGISFIDIDIQELPFASSSTIGWEESLTALAQMDLPSDLEIAWDLKLSSPVEAVEAIFSQAQSLNRNYFIYVYLGADLEFMDAQPFDISKIGLGVMAARNFRGIEYMSKFPEVQIMTVREEEQGGKFDPKLLDRVVRLRGMGYNGRITLDGGINLESAELVNAYSKEEDIHKVSVGSYFQNSSNISEDYDKLVVALNI